MSYAIVPSFTPARSVAEATHFYCLRHSTIAPVGSYGTHTVEEHDGRPPCVQHLVAGSTRVEVAPVAPAEVYCQTHDIFDCPFHKDR